MIHLVSTKVVEKVCQCGQPILKAFSQGIPAEVDPRPLTATEEIAALLEDRWTFVLTRYGELVHRDATRIRGGRIVGTIHAQHRCPPTYAQPILIGAT